MVKRMASRSSSDSWIAKESQPAVDDFLRRHRTLHELVLAGGEVLDVVVQDEFTHDVVARISIAKAGLVKDGAGSGKGPSTGEIIVVFDST